METNTHERLIKWKDGYHLNKKWSTIWSFIKTASNILENKMKERKRGGRHGPSLASIKADRPIAKWLQWIERK
jgi:hypothetical protein